MSQQRDVILVIDDDPEARTLLREQVFSSDNFQVIEAKDGPEAVAVLQRHRPDLILLDLQLPGLSGRDVMVAVKARGFRGPIIVMADSGQEQNAIDAFRLGATDFITRPIRETQVMIAVERGLADVRVRRQRDAMTAQLQQISQQLEARTNELTALCDVGQTVATSRELDGLFGRVLDGALTVTRADHALLLLRDEKNSQMILKAGKNLQLSLLDKMGEPVQDQLAELVMTSREAVVVSGEGLRRFSVSRDLYSVAYAPLAVHNMAIGVLAVGNHQTQRVFEERQGRLLNALASYAAIAIVNARLFAMIDQRTRVLESTYREVRERDAQRGRQLQIVLARLNGPLTEIQNELLNLINGSAGKLPQNAADRMAALGQQVRQLSTLVSNMAQKS